MIDVSVIMPTYQRRDVLARTLADYDRQTLARERFEVIVADDGSRDGTGELVASMQSRVGYALRYVGLAGNGGPAAARNRAFRQAGGRILVLVGDDIFPAPDLLAQHLAWHDEQFPDEAAGMLGRIAWSAELECTELMRWLEKSGTQFAYGSLAHGQALGYEFLYTSNVSLKRAFLERTGIVFNEALRFCEDSDWALRLYRAGFAMRYNALARGEHYHPVTLASSLARSEALGASMVKLAEESPENFARVSGGHLGRQRSWRSRLLALALNPLLGSLVYRPLAALCERRILADRIFAACHASYLLRGFTAARGAVR